MVFGRATWLYGLFGHGRYVTSELQAILRHCATDVGDS